jgi:cell division transport system permease protein
VTIQIKPRAGDDVEALVAKAADIAAHSPGVADARALSKDDTQRMLEPWLGQGLDLSQLTIPRLIVIHMSGRDLADLETLRTALARAIPQAGLDDHRMWLARLDTMADVIVAFALAIFALMIVAMATAVGFATRGAMAGNREIIEVLHFVGAADAFIAAQFQAHFMRLGFRGATIGCAGAALFFAGASLLSHYWAASSGGEEIAALFGAFALSASGYVAIAAIGVFIAGLTGFLSRLIVFTHLRGLP